MSRLVLGTLGAFGAAATVVTGTAVGYGTMLGASVSPCQCTTHERRLNSSHSTSSSSQMVVKEATRRDAYDTLAKSFDSEIEWHELMTGIKLMRWWMLRNVKGDVLEVAAGTGRNLVYYPGGVRLTATDVSKPMVDVFREKATAEAYEVNDEKKKPKSKKSETNANDESSRTPLVSNTRLLVSTHIADTQNTQLPGNSFDSVVDTFGLCSFEDPVRALREMGRVCRKVTVKNTKTKGSKLLKNNLNASTDANSNSNNSNNSGRIYLLEHGRSDYGWLNNILDKHADKHASHWGCYWNRDIEGIVKQSGLKIVEMKKFHFGTTYYIVCEPVGEE